MTQDITLEALRARLDRGLPTLLVEALPPRYFDDGHLPGAIRFDTEEVRSQAAARLADKEAFIIVYCAGPACRNSHQVAAQLAAAGYRKVHVFGGGKAAWSDAGLPLEVRRAAA